jgi:ribosome-binding protein aMBF1 (putative translation factor)
MSPKGEQTRDALKIIDHKFFRGRPDMIAVLEQERLNVRVAMEVYKLRTQAGLTQRELASRVGTTASVICRLENSDYDGHSLKMLQRIAFALGQRVEVRFKPFRRLRRTTKRA